MTDPDRPHAFRRRNITDANIRPTGTHGPYGAFGPTDWDGHVKTERSKTCDVCGGSKESIIHLPRRTRKRRPAWSDYRPGPYAFAREVPR